MKACRGGEVQLDRGKVRSSMEGFGDVLWRHLDEEFEVLGAVSMSFGGWGGWRGCRFDIHTCCLVLMLESDICPRVLNSTTSSWITLSPGIWQNKRLDLLQNLSPM